MLITEAILRHIDTNPMLVIEIYLRHHCTDLTLDTEIFQRHPCREPINVQSITIVCFVATYKRVVNECHSLCFKSDLKILEWPDPFNEIF
jgi:hypothetical protein